MQMYKLKGREILKRKYIKKKIYDLKNRKEKKIKNPNNRPIISRILQNKSQNIHTKERQDSGNVNQSAVEDIEQKQINTAVHSSQYISKNITALKNQKKKLQNKKSSNNAGREKRNENPASKKQDKTGDIKKKTNEKSSSAIKTKKDIQIKTSKNNQEKQSNQLSKIKHINKVKQTSTSKKGIKCNLNSAKQVFSKSFTFLRKSAATMSNLITIGTGIILLVVIILFIGVFSALSDNSNVGSTYLPISKEVMAYSDTINKYAKQYEMEDYITIIQAVMMQESGGKGTDPMQSSECPYNTKYPKKPNAIQDPNYSIEVGIHYLADCFKKANVEDPFDNQNIYLALQGYNYGNGYIEWALKNFGGYSKANAKVFSDQKKAELGTDVYGDPNYVEHVMRYVGLGFGNYREQPNFDNVEAWGSNNPYSVANLYGQCTWFAWGRFYEIYGFSPGFTGNGWSCAEQLVNAHPDKFKLSDTPAVGAIFSCIGRNHTGIVIGWDGTNITIQEGNLDNKTNTFEDAKKDWQTVTYTLAEFQKICNGVIFSVPFQKEHNIKITTKPYKF